MRQLWTLFLLTIVCISWAQPSIPLPSGYTWVSGGSSTYQNGPYYTGNASGNTGNCGGTTCGSNDTSLGGNFQCNSVPWTIVGTPGANFIQSQKYGNIGTGDNSLAGLAVPCNPGVGGTSAGSNWPSTTEETRRVTLTHWNNTNPASDISSLPLASRTSGTVWLPVSASLNFRDDGIGNGTGSGGDELRLTMIGGDNNSCSSWQIDAAYNLSVDVSGAYGLVSGVNGMKITGGVSQTLTNVPNAVVYAYNATNGNAHSCCSGGCSFQATQNSWYFPSGTNTPSFGTGFAQNYDVLSNIVEDGSSFTVDFNSEFSINIDRVGGSSGDARATMGPGMGGKVELVIQYQIWTIQAPAPVKLGEFYAEKQEYSTLLRWTTYSEINNDGFEVQKSLDGQQWETFEFIKGNGNSSDKVHYSAVDRHPAKDKNYYRLIQKDFDGASSISPTRMVTFSASRYGIKLYPNPANEYIFVSSLPDQAKVEINDAWGKSIHLQMIENEGKIDIGHLRSGVYIMKINLIDGSEYYKFIKTE